MRLLALAGCLTIGLAFAVGPTANAQMSGSEGSLPCHDYQKIAETLGKRYGETPVSLGLQTNGHLLQVFSSPESGSWTILSVTPTGIGCIVAAGRNWQSRQPGIDGPRV
jgi:hypothetical protein